MVSATTSESLALAKALALTCKGWLCEPARAGRSLRLPFEREGLGADDRALTAVLKPPIFWAIVPH